MANWISDNLATIIICIVLIAALTMVVVIMRKDKKQGKSSCGGNCGHCPMGNSCHHN